MRVPAGYLPGSDSGSPPKGIAEKDGWPGVRGRVRVAADRPGVAALLEHARARVIPATTNNLSRNSHRTRTPRTIFAGSVRR